MHGTHEKKQGESGERSKEIDPSPAIAHSMGFSEQVKEVKDEIAKGMY